MASGSAYPPGALLNDGRYRVQRELNRGATAIVYAAEDTKTHQTVALKVMNCSEKVPVEIVKREIAFSSSMVHENIVRMMDVFAQSRNELVIVWELIQGVDLLERLNECGGCMNEAQAAFYFVQLLKGVLAIHSHGFCHRDLKPENCMVERDSEKVKLIDFGLTKHLESAQTLGVGTPDYLAPEMLRFNASGSRQRGKPPYDPCAVDAWAMGVTLYLLVTGKYPFEDPTAPHNLARTISNILQGRMRPLPHNISHDCAALIQRLLKVNPEERLTIRDLSREPWLQRVASQYAAHIGRLHLVQQDNATDAAPPAQRGSSDVQRLGSADQQRRGSNERRSGEGMPKVTGPAPALAAAGCHQCGAQTGTCRCAYESSAASVGGSSSRGSGSGRNIGAAVSGACGMDETPTGTLDDVVAGLKPGKKNKPTKGRLGSLFVRKEKKDSPPCKMA